MRPGVNLRNLTTSNRGNPPTATGTAFVGITAQRGPSDTPRLCHNMTDVVKFYGPRQSNMIGWDALDAAFQVGVTDAWVIRAVDPAATKATRTYNDVAAAPAIAVDAIGEGTSTLSVQVVAGGGAGTYVLVVTDAGVEIERSYDLPDNDTAVVWSTQSPNIRVRKLGAVNANPIAAQTLTGATADVLGNIIDSVKVAALAKFTKDLGPGQILWPGGTTDAIHLGLNNHAVAMNRHYLGDCVDSATPSTVYASATYLRGVANLDESYGILLAAQAIIPGITATTTRTVPYSAIQAGLIAALDAVTHNPNEAAAGVQGQADYVIDLTQHYSDTEVQTLNGQGIVVPRMVYGACRTYGNRTPNDAVLNPAYLQATASRLRMALNAEGAAIGENYVFSQMDGAGHDIAAFHGDIEGMMRKYYDMGALYGAKPTDAYRVDTGPNVNSATTINNGELHAGLTFKHSPFAEEVDMDLTLYPLTQSI